MSRRAGLTLQRLIDLTSAGPQRIFGIVGKGRIAVGYDADFSIVDLKARWTIEEDWLASRCGWSPFTGMSADRQADRHDHPRPPRDVGRRAGRRRARRADPVRGGRFRVTSADTPRRNRMLRHDLRVVRREMAGVLAGWSDRITLLLGIALVVAMARGGIAAAAPRTALIAGGVIGLWGGWASAGMIARRFGFHADVYLFADEASSARSRRRYVTAIGAMIAAISALAATMIDPRTTLPLIAGLASGAILSLAIGKRSRSRDARVAGRKDWRGVLAASVAVVAIITAKILANRVAEGFAVAAAALATAVVTPVDAGTVRFEAIAGRGAGWSIARHLRDGAVLALVATAAMAATLGAVAAALAALATGMMLAMAGIRVLAYRWLDQRSADLLLTAGIAAVAIGATVVLVLAPLLAAGLIAVLCRRSHRARWLVA